MLQEKLIIQVARFIHDDMLAFSAFNLFLIVTEGAIVAETDFVPWFDEQVQRLELVEGKHYYIFCGKKLETKITGHAALAILISQDNEIGAYARRIAIGAGYEDIAFLLEVSCLKLFA